MKIEMVGFLKARIASLEERIATKEDILATREKSIKTLESIAESRQRQMLQWQNAYQNLKRSQRQLKIL